ncbi:ammonium transporter [Nocardia asteroides]|uniref:ammonium transporter n=1 Tax=Nocardia asteroides TaxID=1824 RepID=UPI001E59C306|nr:ammonium transporter [Nocardia asteroides]UGT59839.1 ammonium transporter [Nocardia asteroides]
MILRKIAAVVAPLLTVVTVGAGVAYADTPTPDVGYEVKMVDGKVVTALTNGTFAVTGETVEIKDSAGAVLVSLPLAIRENATEYPLPHAVREDDRVLELTPVKNEAAARAVPVASPVENLRAQDAFLSNFGIATAIGGFIGTAIGALVGLAGFAGGPAGIATVTAGAAIGGIIGTLIAGGPTLIVAGMDLINTLNAPPGTTQWATK